MAFTRSRLKQMAKNVIKHNYLKAVLITCLSALSITTIIILNETVGLINYRLVQVFFVLSSFSGIIQLFVFNVLMIACIKTSLGLLYREVSFHTIIERFKQGYLNTVLVVLIYNTVLFLWSLLFVIPGIYKKYQYSMIPYLLAEHPDMSYREARDLSKILTKGEKFHIFVLDLSFIGWHLFGIITFGLGELLYVSPYVHFSYCALYEALKAARPELSL